MTQIAIPTMTDRMAAEHRHLAKARLVRTLRRLRLMLLLWRRRRSERLALVRLLAEISDPRLIRDVGLPPPPPRRLERWITASFEHRR